MIKQYSNELWVHQNKHFISFFFPDLMHLLHPTARTSFNLLLQAKFNRPLQSHNFF